MRSNSYSSYPLWSAISLFFGKYHAHYTTIFVF